MERAANIADALPFGIQQRPSATPLSVMSYNISLNFSSILAKLSGSRLLARLRRGVDHSPIDTPHPVASVVEEWATETSLDVDTTPPIAAAVDKLGPIPGPWAFFASGYMFGLLLMTIVLHRMRNVIVPSRILARRRRPAFPFQASISPFEYPYISRRLFSSILPLDFSRTTTRLAFHLPSIYLLSKMLLIWCLLVLQTCQLLPSCSEDQKSAYWGILAYVERLGVWSSQKEMADICWATFCTVCAALLVDGLVNALDGIGSALPIANVTSNTSPFNFVGYAFLLHAYSFPIAHSHKPTDESPSRPDKHAIMTIAIPLFQLTIFHILSVSKHHSRHRLIPTALTSFLSLAHFHGTLFLHFFGSSSTSPTDPTISLARLKSTSYLGGSKFTYPLLNYVPNIFETILIGTILLTISLNALVQLLARGRVDRIFSGLGVRSGANLQDGDDETTTSGFFQQLPYEEDFGILLLRVGTASLEATGLRGWNNEVAPIPLPANSIIRKRAREKYLRGNKFPAQTHGVVRMGRMAVTEVQYGSRAYPSTSTSGVEPSSSPPNPYENFPIRRRWHTQYNETPKQQQQRGLLNEVRTIELGVTNASGPSREITGWWRRIKRIWPFLVALLDVLKGLVLFLWDKARSRGRSQQCDRVEKASTTIRTSAGQVEDCQGIEDDDDDRRRMDKEREVYSRFLRGEEISDDEHDDDFTSSLEEEDSHRGVEDDNEEEEEEEEEGEEGEEDGQGEAIRLFSDFLQSRHGCPTTSVDGGGGEMVLAHLLHGQATSSGPLTRRGWRELVEKRGVGGAREDRSPFRIDEDDIDIWNQPSFNISGATPADSQQSFSTTACVICTNEQRDIICWPCRCLAMCDNCREALSSRSTPSKHCCPCCRQIVEGYSKIYIP